ncbi:MAG: SDR family oxidoreductase [Phycisphaeraceae bacterium]|nr:SDR family oxidoreductase [Phycisphaeraceae bacterium]
MTTNHGPVALVTGAGSGIGRAIAVQLAARGYRLLLVGRRTAALEETGTMLSGERGIAWRAHSADVGEAAACARAVDAAVSAFGRLDALVSNAGIAELRTVAEHSADDVRRTFEVNALGPAWLTAAAWPLFERQGGGCVVFVSSVASVDPFPGLGVYGAAKASLNTLARACAVEGERFGLRAFSVAPGAVETPMLRSMFTPSDLPARACLTPEQVAAVVVECIAGTRDAENGRTILIPSP